ncbi:MAG: glycosyltransferase, partial [Verrucomicrobiaceae bacterium]
HVTYEPCLYEAIPQPVDPPKHGYALHLASREPHKRTAWLIRQWVEEGARNPALPALHVVGSLPEDVEQLASSSALVERLPFLDDDALRSQFSSARALILPSEIEGFGLPAIEAYYLGTPVCYTRGTSIEEVLEPVTARGGFSLDEPSSLFAALDDVSRIPPQDIHDCGLKLREIYAASSVAERMMTVFAALSR